MAYFLAGHHTVGVCFFSSFYLDLDLAVGAAEKQAPLSLCTFTLS